MFGAEPLEPWTKEAAAEFEAHVSARTRMCLRRAGRATAVLVVTIFAIGPFLAGHSLHRYWERGAKLLLLVAFLELLWVLQQWLMVYGSWQAARETRREMGEPL